MCKSASSGRFHLPCKKYRGGLIRICAAVSALAVVSIISFRYISSPHPGGVFLAPVFSSEELAQKKAAWDALERTVAREAAKFKGSIGIVIKDLDTGWTIAVNQNKLFPSASLVKIPIMASYFYAEQENKIALTQRMVLRNRNKTPGSGTLKCLPDGTAFQISDLIERMIVESDNTAANMLIDRVGFDYLNWSFKRMGLDNTNLVRKMMDFKKRKKGVENYTTAVDLSKILEDMYDGRFIGRSVSAQCLGILRKQKIRDRIPALLPSYTDVAHKTGLENGVCHDAGIVFTPQGDYLICVLTRHYNKTARPVKKVISRMALEVYNYKTAGAQEPLRQAKNF